MVQAFTHGFLLALGLILPLGVQNVFIFNQGIYHRRWLRVLPAVLVAGLSDTTLILTAVLGVSLIILKFAWIRASFTIFGVIFLIFLGLSTWKSEVKTLRDDGNGAWPVKKQILFTFSVSLLNPHAIADTIGVIGTSSLAYTVFEEKFAFTIATVMVSWLWFLSLTLLGRAVGNLDRAGHLQQTINKVSAVIIWFSAIILARNLMVI